jgi:uncharacterized delta-60 repeat protein
LKAEVLYDRALMAGDLDTTFDGDGKVTTDLVFGENLNDRASSVAIQSDGKIVVAGYSSGSGIHDFALVRYNSDGSLDTTFDGDGKVTTDFGAGDSAYSVAIQSDGKIVVAGFSFNGRNGDFALARYNSNGSLDTTFDGDGKVTMDFGGEDYASSVAIQSDGKIVVAGSSQKTLNSPYDFALARYTSNGILDTTFGSNGKVTTDFGSYDTASSVAIQSDGKIVVAGESLRSPQYDFALARYDSDGSLDTTFDSDGKVTTDFGGDYDGAFSVAIQIDGKIVVAGGSDNSSSRNDFALARYESNGNLDTTFDGDGKVTTDFGGNDEGAKSVAIQSDGKIVVAGHSGNIGSTDFQLARYNSNGSLDTTFDGDGKVTTTVGSAASRAISVAIQSDGKIVVAGRSDNGSSLDFALTRYNVNEAPTDITLSTTSIAENAPANTKVGTFSTIDPDSGDTFTYSLVAGTGDTDNGAFNISDSNLLATSNLDFEAKSSYTIRIRSTDQSGLFTEKTFTITVIDINESPTNISLSSNTIAENSEADTPVGTLSTTDPDAGNTFTYALVTGSGDTDNASFSINGSTLQATGSFDFETKSSYTVRIRSTDQNGLFVEKAFAIQVVNVNETPTDISLSSNTIAENSASNTAVGTLSTTDVDTGNSFSYSFVAGAGDTENSAFTISGTTLRATSGFNFETKSSYTVRVRSTDQGGRFVDKAFTIQVLDVNESPTDINLTSTAIPENAGSNATVGIFSTADVDAGNTFAYSLVAGSGDTDNGAFNISGSTLRATGSFDFETRTDYTIRIRSTDQDGLFVEKEFAIRVVNANDAPVAVGDSYWVSVDTFQILDVLANDLDVDSAIDPTSIEIFSPPSHGTATPLPDGTVRYTPNAGYRGAESFTYRVRDSLGFLSNSATVQLRVNSAPNTNTDFLVVRETITTVLDVLRNDNDPDGSLDPTSVVIVSGPDMADVVVQSNGTIRFTPRAGFLGTTQFRYVVSDNDGRPSVPTDVTVLVVVSIYQNPRNRFDVDGEGTVSPLDVLVLINLLNSQGPSLQVDGLPGPPAYVDVNADNRVDPLDVLDVINHINSRGNGEGEGIAVCTFDDVFASDDWQEELRKSIRLRLTRF